MDVRRASIFVVLLTVLASISLVSVLFGNNYALAENPSSCVNRYDAVITSLKINDGHRIIDPVAKPNTHFTAKLGVGYTVTVTLHSASVSSLGNTDVGSIWYGSTAYGFASDHCVNGVNHDSDVTFTLYNVFMGQATHGTAQPVEWYSFPLSGPTVTYTVHWN